jgi:DNA-directed RNA polymerase subunit RPC12/RpoP
VSQIQGIECPYCSTITTINLDKFPRHQKIGLYDKCPDCKRAFGFDIETKIHLTAYPVQNSACH